MTTRKIWFASDYHFGHRGIIDYTKRPFKSLEEMDLILIQNWNDCVSLLDEVYFLGDFSFYRPPKTTEILCQLNGRKYLIKGNHDHKKDLKKVVGWEWIKEYHELKYNKQLFILMHYPIRVWKLAQEGAIHLHGHSHGNLEPIGKAIDVGADSWHYKPVSIDTIVEKASLMDYVQQDHHKLKQRLPSSA